MMDVRARDASGAESLTRVEFSLDNTRSSFPILARIALMMDITTLVIINNINSFVCAFIYLKKFNSTTVSSAFLRCRNAMHCPILCHKILPNENPSYVNLYF